MPTLTLGFVGGLELTRRVPAEQVDGLRDALARDDAPWHALETEHGTVTVALGRLAYVELDAARSPPGFA